MQSYLVKPRLHIENRHTQKKQTWEPMLQYLFPMQSIVLGVDGFQISVYVVGDHRSVF